MSSMTSSLGKWMRSGALVLALGTVAPVAAHAENKIDEKNWVKAYLTLQEPEITAGPVEILDFSSPFAITSDCGSSTPMSVDWIGTAVAADETLKAVDKALDTVDIVLDKIINIGSKIWSIVAGNAPVVKLNMPSAYALPSGTQCWTDLENWEQPNSQQFTISYKNALGITVVDFHYRLIYTYGGSYEGSGKYLANVTVVPAKVDVAWGFNFNAEVNVGDLINLGTRTNPEAGMELAVKWNINTIFQSIQKIENYFIRGNGGIVQL